ncbi:MAG: hypothetical protein ABGZ53_25105 [Fuerstiella sp.]
MSDPTPTSSLISAVILLHQICTPPEAIARRVRCSIRQVNHIIEFGCLDPSEAVGPLWSDDRQPEAERVSDR